MGHIVLVVPRDLWRPCGRSRTSRACPRARPTPPPPRRRHTGSSVGRNNAPRTTPVAAKSTLTSCGKALAADTTGGYRSAPPARTGPGTGLYRSDDRRRPGAPVPHEIVPVHATGPRYMHFGIYGGSPRAAARSIRRIGGRGCRAPMAAPSSSTIGPRAQPSDSIRVAPWSREPQSRRERGPRWRLSLRLVHTSLLAENFELG